MKIAYLTVGILSLLTPLSAAWSKEGKLTGLLAIDKPHKLAIPSI